MGLQSQEELGTYVDFYFLPVDISEDFGGKSCFNLKSGSSSDHGIESNDFWCSGCALASRSGHSRFDLTDVRSLMGSHGCGGLYNCPVMCPDTVILGPEEPAGLAHPLLGLHILRF